MVRNYAHRAKPAYLSVAQQDRFRQESALLSPALLCPQILVQTRFLNVLLRGWFHTPLSGLINHRFNDDGHHPSTLHLKNVGSMRREVDDASADVWTAVIDFDDDRAAIVEVRYLRVRGQRK